MGRFRIRKRFRVLFLAAAAAVIAVPVGFALSPSLGPASPGLRGTFAAVPAANAWSFSGPRAVGGAAAVLVAPIDASGPIVDDVTDAAKLFLVGTLLIGAAAAVRKAP
jgi:hypothetical protein